MDKDNFFVILPSNVKTDEFPDNKIGHFYTPLPHSLDLKSGQWEVSMVGLNYPHNWFNILPPLNYINFTKKVQKTVKKKDKDGNFELDDDGNFIYIFERDENGKVIEEWQNVTKFITPNFYNVKELLHEIEYIKPEDYHSKFVMNIKNERIKFILRAREGIYLNKGLYDLLGFSEQHLFNNEERKSKTVEAKYAADINANLHSLYVYTNIVQDTLVGTSYVPLLRIVNVSGKYQSQIDKIFNNPFYIDILHNKIKTIEISICDDQGQLIPFQSGKCIVKLHFKRKKFPIY